MFTSRRNDLAVGRLLFLAVLSAEGGSSDRSRAIVSSVEVLEKKMFFLLLVLCVTPQRLSIFPNATASYAAFNVCPFDLNNCSV